MRSATGAPEETLAPRRTPHKVLFFICLMSAQKQIVSAICKFDDWSHPWRFASSVTESLGAADAKLFEEVWAEAGDQKHWLEASDLPAATAASEALTARFPWLSPEAVKAIANAAAYQWR